MRLTLRALLAYLYNVLEPVEAEEFGAKVHESPVASGLVQRIRGITHKVRMSAPRIDAKGLTDDASNVAEYLDNNLAEDRVADFERTCLESDMHLAEVAGSYQILTMVLGKPAEVPAHLRERLYALPKEADASIHAPHADEESAEKSRVRSRIVKAATAAVDHSRPQAEVKTGSTHPVPEVPDYLRGGSRLGPVPLIAAALLAFLLVAAGIRLLGPYDRTNPAFAWMFAAEPIADAGNSANSVTTAEADKTKSSTDASVLANADKSVNIEPLKNPGEPISPESPAENVKEPAAPPSGIKKETIPAEPLVPESPVEPAPEPVKTVPEPALKGPKIPGAKPAVVVAATEGPELGRYISDEQVLARYSPKEKLWRLAAPRDLIFAGERLQVLPAYRPQIALSSGAQITFAGESLVHLEAAKMPGASRMTVHYGKLVVVTVGMPGVPLELDLAGLKGTLILSDADAGVAIDARRYLPPGSDPEKDPAFGIIEIFTTSGRAAWHVEGQDPVEVPAGYLLTYVLGGDAVEPDLAGPFRAPPWIDASSVSSIDRVTSLDLLKLLDPEKPLDVRLQELMSDPRVDVRALAARCLGYLDQFEPLLKELGNVQQKSFWGVEVEALRQALARSPETAANLRETAEALRGMQAGTIYRLLWGYSPEQLADIGAAELVNLLDSPEIDIRILAIHNLRHITLAQQNYRPEKRPDENKLPINSWKDRLKKGTIVYKADPSPFMERRPLASAAGEKGK